MREQALLIARIFLSQLAFMCDSAHIYNAALDILPSMPISKAEREELLTSVFIEMEKMFTILSNCVKPGHDDERLLLDKIETAFKSILPTIE